MLNKINRKLTGTILLVIYFAAVAYLCFGHFEDMPEVSKYIFGIPTDKIVHFLMFFPMPFLFWFAYGEINKKPWHSIVFCVCAFIVSCIVAGSTEIGQSYTSYRSCDPLDFKADCIAILICSIITLIIDQITHLYTKCSKN